METFTIFLQTREREELIDITTEIKQTLKKSSVKRGYVKISIPHTTAAVTINENSDSAVAYDFLTTLRKLIPKNRESQHVEGNSDAHLKSSIIGSRMDIIIEEGQLKLGQWQGIFFCEFDGPRSRKVYLNVFGE